MSSLLVLLLLGAYALPGLSVARDSLSPMETGSGSLMPAVHHFLFVNTTCEEEGFSSERVLPDVELALNVVNQKLALHGETSTALKVHTVNAEAHGSSSLSLLLENLLTTPEASAMLYPGCSEYTGILADISGRLLNLTVMFPSEDHLATALAAFIDYFQWKRAVILTQDAPIFTSIFNHLEQALEDMSVNVTNKIILGGPLKEEEIFPPDNRVFVLNMNPSSARAVLCEAFNSGKQYPGYVWITYGWYSEQWWSAEGMTKLDNCSSEEIVSVLEGAIAVTHFPTASSHPQPTNHSFRMYAMSVYDAVMSLADETLHPLLDDVPSFGSSASFNKNGVRVEDNITFYQYRKGPDGSLSREVIGFIHHSPGNLTLTQGEDELTLWLEGVPSDGSPETEENYSMLPLMAICYTGATAGILFAFVCLLFNIVFRNKKLIRLTSPTLNYVIILGTIIIYSSVYAYFYVPSTSETLFVVGCNLRLWLTSLGYVLTFVPINVKMWRVFHICNKPRPSMKNVFMKDWHLILIIGIFVILDVVLLTIVTAVNNSRYTLKIIPDKEHPGTSINDDGITISYTVKRCYSATEPYWISVLFGYKLLLQAIGVFLAFNIRKVKIKGLNDSKEVSAILYVTTVVIGVVIVVTFVFGDYINVDGGTYGLGLTMATTVVLTFIFIPKMYGLYRDPKGENIFSTPSPDRPNGTARSQLGSCTGMVYDATDDNKIVIAALHKRIKELEAKLSGEVKSPVHTSLFISNCSKQDELQKSSSGEAVLSVTDDCACSDE